MKKKVQGFLCFTIVIALFFFNGVISASTINVKLYYGDFSVNGLQWMPGSWNLNHGDLVISYSLDLTGAPNVAYDWNYSGQGIVGIFSPDWTGARMAGNLSDWANRTEQFPIYPDIDNYQDLDDKFNLQRFPNPEPWGESVYDILCDGSPIGTFSPGDNYGIWFDRDGVDPWQPTLWGNVDGGTYNTLGIYDLELTYKKHSSTLGYLCARFFPDLPNPLDHSDPTDDIFGIPTGFYESGWTLTGPEKFPAGISFETDETNMSDFGVYVDGNPSVGTIIVKDLTVEGYLNLDEGMATGGGWFIAENNGNFAGTTPGGKATFGFMAKQKKGSSSGQLEFQYHADDLNLKSSSYDWVTLATIQVMFEGEGTLNGIPGSKFRVRAVDGDKIGTGIDRFEIRIWTGVGTFDMPTYRAEGDLSGGQIVVHKK